MALESSDEEDVHQCGRCKTTFTDVDRYFEHKRQQKCLKAKKLSTENKSIIESAVLVETGFTHIQAARCGDHNVVEDVEAITRFQIEDDGYLKPEKETSDSEQRENSSQNLSFMETSVEATPSALSLEPDENIETGGKQNGLEYLSSIGLIETVNHSKGTVAEDVADTTKHGGTSSQAYRDNIIGTPVKKRRSAREFCHTDIFASSVSSENDCKTARTKRRNTAKNHKKAWVENYQDLQTKPPKKSDSEAPVKKRKVSPPAASGSVSHPSHWGSPQVLRTYSRQPATQSNATPDSKDSYGSPYHENSTTASRKSARQTKASYKKSNYSELDVGFSFRDCSEVSTELAERETGEKHSVSIPEPVIDRQRCKYYTERHCNILFRVVLHEFETHNEPQDLEPLENEYGYIFITFRCLECQHVVQSYEAIVNHLREHSNLHQNICQFCGRWFPTRQKLSRHYSCALHVPHISPDRLVASKQRAMTAGSGTDLRECVGGRERCVLCQRVFRTLTEFAKHALSKHTPIEMIKKYKCGVCDKQTTEALELSQHVRAQHGSTAGYSHVCPVCDKLFAQRIFFKRHFDALHVPMIEEIRCESVLSGEATNQDPSQTPFCFVCCQSFTLQRLLRVHLQLHKVWVADPDNGPLPSNLLGENPTTSGTVTVINRASMEAMRKERVQGGVDTRVRNKSQALFELGANSGNRTLQHKQEYQLQREKHVSSSDFNTDSCDSVQREFDTDGNVRLIRILSKPTSHTARAADTGQAIQSSIKTERERVIQTDHVTPQDTWDLEAWGSRGESVGIECNEERVEAALSCPYCDYQAQCLVTMREHKSQQHRLVHVYKCVVQECSMVFHDLAAYESHSAVHSQKSFICSRCNLHFATSTDLHTHKASSHRVALGKIPTNTLQAQAEGETEKGRGQVKVESGGNKPQSFLCDMCGQVFHNRQSLSKHRQTHGERRFPCRHCDQRFNKAEHLRRHIAAKHSQLRPFSCDQPGCHKAFTRKDKLQLHMLKHSKEKPHKCTVCGRSYGYREGLRYHMERAHRPSGDDVSGGGGGGGVHRCAECGVTFTRPGQLAQHRASQHAVDTSASHAYLCPQCPASFHRPERLKRHLQHKHETNVRWPLSCSYCKKGFAGQKSLDTHTRNKHSYQKQKLNKIEKLIEEASGYKTNTGEVEEQTLDLPISGNQQSSQIFVLYQPPNQSQGKTDVVTQVTVAPPHTMDHPHTVQWSAQPDLPVLPVATPQQVAAKAAPVPENLIRILSKPVVSFSTNSGQPPAETEFYEQPIEKGWLVDEMGVATTNMPTTEKAANVDVLLEPNTGVSDVTTINQTVTVPSLYPYLVFPNEAPVNSTNTVDLPQFLLQNIESRHGVPPGQDSVKVSSGKTAFSRAPRKQRILSYLDPESTAERKNSVPPTATGSSSQPQYDTLVCKPLTGTSFGSQDGDVAVTMEQPVAVATQYTPALNQYVQTSIASTTNFDEPPSNDFVYPSSDNFELKQILQGNQRDQQDEPDLRADENDFILEDQGQEVGKYVTVTTIMTGSPVVQPKRDPKDILTELLLGKIVASGTLDTLTKSFSYPKKSGATAKPGSRPGVAITTGTASTSRDYFSTTSVADSVYIKSPGFVRNQEVARSLSQHDITAVSSIQSNISPPSSSAAQTKPKRKRALTVRSQIERRNELERLRQLQQQDAPASASSAGPDESTVTTVAMPQNVLGSLFSLTTLPSSTYSVLTAGNVAVTAPATSTATSFVLNPAFQKFQQHVLQSNVVVSSMPHGDMISNQTLAEILGHQSQILQAATTGAETAPPVFVVTDIGQGDALTSHV